VLARYIKKYVALVIKTNSALIKVSIFFNEILINKGGAGCFSNILLKEVLNSVITEMVKVIVLKSRNAPVNIFSAG